MNSQHTFHTIPCRQGWRVKEGGEILSTHPTQKEGWDAAVKASRLTLAQGKRCRAILHRLDGSIREERVYGRTLP
ncbi:MULTISPECIES: DUF2188 domain-containing protein [Hyphomicrobiales]|jgi:hypothetical protein|uniref:DUF2188 domain-containing protein n=1 Tax=Hyphomicrobiales TaxID=356 RepID=UPI0009D9AE05|nr:MULTISPECIES: DUF2188 domain-containing protein [Phyllobacteriaceae]MCX8572048.1 DUF2188 domain-containing protein [Aminobacter sp. MET-1]